MITIDFCYKVVTPESSEQGDVSEQGFIMPGMWKYTIKDYDRNIWKLGDLAGLIDFAKSLGIYCNDGSYWFYSTDPDINFQTGEYTTYSMHIYGVTPSTYNRIYKLLNG